MWPQGPSQVLGFVLPLSPDFKMQFPVLEDEDQSCPQNPQLGSFGGTRLDTGASSLRPERT